MGRTVLLAGRINRGNCKNPGIKTIGCRPPNTG
jgi:hypothetical protein